MKKQITGQKFNKKFNFLVKYTNFNKKGVTNKREFFNEKGEKI